MSCDVDALSIGGQCLPGTYQLSYTVTDDGVSATATRTVVVYQAGSITSTFALYKAVTNATAADAIVADLRNISSQAFAKALSTIKKTLGAAGSSLDSSSLDITSATVSANGASHDVVVTAVLYVYYPSAATRGAINSTSAGAAVASRRRRLLQLDGWLGAEGGMGQQAMLDGRQGSAAGFKQRRQLLQGGGSFLAGAQGSMGAALASSFNASGLSATTTSASVDLVQVRECCSAV